MNIFTHPTTVGALSYHVNTCYTAQRETAYLSGLPRDRHRVKRRDQESEKELNESFIPVLYLCAVLYTCKSYSKCVVFNPTNTFTHVVTGAKMRNFRL